MNSVVVIGGPTASGKSGLAVALAQDLGGLVVNADSLQLYSALPILTAQPGAEDHARVPHDLYAVAHPNDRYDAARWRDCALSAIARAHAQGRLPVVVGGTGFYLKALLEGLSPIPAVNAQTRQQVQGLYKAQGLEALRQETARLDPVIMDRIDINNPHRLMRACEVALATGRPLSAWQELPLQGAPEGMRFFTIVIDPPRADLHAAIASRLDVMLDAGVEEEVRLFAQRLASGEISSGTPLTHACGYHALTVWQEGQGSRQEAHAALLADTRNYAKRQQTWFRNQLRCGLRLARVDIASTLDAVRAWLSA